MVCWSSEGVCSYPFRYQRPCIWNSIHCIVCAFARVCDTWKSRHLPKVCKLFIKHQVRRNVWVLFDKKGYFIAFFFLVHPAYFNISSTVRVVLEFHSSHWLVQLPLHRQDLWCPLQPWSRSAARGRVGLRPAAQWPQTLTMSYQLSSHLSVKEPAPDVATIREWAMPGTSVLKSLEFVILNTVTLILHCWSTTAKSHLLGASIFTSI